MPCFLLDESESPGFVPILCLAAKKKKKHLNSGGKFENKTLLYYCVFLKCRCVQLHLTITRHINFKFPFVDSLSIKSNGISCFSLLVCKGSFGFSPRCHWSSWLLDLQYRQTWIRDMSNCTCPAEITIARQKM